MLYIGNLKGFMAAMHVPHTPAHTNSRKQNSKAPEWEPQSQSWMFPAVDKLHFVSGRFAHRFDLSF